MSKKLAGYIFRRIGGRIVPIRKSLAMAPAAINNMAAAVKARGHRHVMGMVPKLRNAMQPSLPGFPPRQLLQYPKKLGKGVDFDVFKIHDMNAVLKIPANNPTREITGKQILKAIPNINDKVARSQAVAHNLPNFGVETHGPSFSVRIRRQLKALVQPFTKTGRPTGKPGPDTASAGHRMSRAWKEIDTLSRKSGLGLDGHYSNMTHRGELVDTAMGKIVNNEMITTGRRMTEGFPGGGFLGHSDPAMAKEILTGGFWGKAPKDFKKADFMTERAALEGASGKIGRTLKALKKKGWRLKPAGNDTFELLSPEQRVQRFKLRGRMKK